MKDMLDLYETNAGQERPISEYHAAALRYAGDGFFVLPLKPREKKPAITAWRENATTDREVIYRWWTQWPKANVGLVTGVSRARPLVVDIDQKNGKDGYQSLADVIDLSGVKTAAVRTPTGGKHLYYWATENAWNRNGILTGIDIRAIGGYVVAPPSRTEAGQYHWEATLENGVDKLPVDLAAYVYSAPAALSMSTEEGSACGDLKQDELWPLLSRISPDLPRDAWIAVIAASINELGKKKEVIEELKCWSRLSATKFDLADFDKAIASINANHQRKTTAATLNKLGEMYFSPFLGLPRLQYELIPEALKESEDVLFLTEEMLTEFGANVSSRHREGLRQAARALIWGQLTTESGATVVPLPTGCGKSTAVNAYARHLVAMQPNTGLLIACNTVREQEERLEQLLRWLPKDAAGLRHNSHGVSTPSIGAEECEQYQVLLVTHNRLIDRGGDSFWNYRGAARNIVWDEALTLVRGTALQVRRAYKEIGSALAEYELIELETPNPSIGAAHKKVLAFLMGTRDALRSNLKGDTFVLPELTEGLPHDFPIRSQELSALAEFQSKEVRVIDSLSGPAVLVGFERILNQVKRQITVLDAGAPFRRLMDVEAEVTVLPTVDVKDYSRVTIRPCRSRAGRGFFERNLEDSGLLEELRHLMNEVIPDDEDVVVFTHSSKADKNYETMFRWAIPRERKGRVEVVTWGRERGVNNFRDVNYGVVMGLTYRDLAELAATYLGSKKDISAEVTQREVEKIRKSEQVDALYQALSRLNCRNIQNGLAGRTEFYVFQPDMDVIYDLEKALPGVVIDPYEASFLREVNLDEIQSVEAMLAALKTTEKFKISITELRRMAEIVIPPVDRAWVRIRRKFLERASRDWSLEGYSLVRKT